VSVHDGARPRLGFRSLRVGQTEGNRDIRGAAFMDQRIQRFANAVDGVPLELQLL
jgi:hypothetical protein